MDYQKMDVEFVSLVEMIANDDMRVEIIFEALKTMQEHPYSTPKLALQVGIQEWAK